MGIGISVDVEPGCVCVHCSGRFASGDYEQTVRTVVDAVLLYGRSRVLIDASEVVGPIPESDYVTGPAYLLAEIEQRAPGRIAKIAFVAGERQVDPHKRGEKIVNEAGIPAHVFTSLEDATDWLARP